MQVATTKRETGLNAGPDPEDSIEMRSWKELYKVIFEWTKETYGMDILLTEMDQVLYTRTRYARWGE